MTAQDALTAGQLADIIQRVKAGEPYDMFTALIEALRESTPSAIAAEPVCGGEAQSHLPGSPDLPAPEPEPQKLEQSQSSHCVLVPERRLQHSGNAFTAEESDAMSAAFTRAQKQHGHYETLYAVVCAWLDVVANRYIESRKLQETTASARATEGITGALDTPQSPPVRASPEPPQDASHVPPMRMLKDLNMAPAASQGAGGGQAGGHITLMQDGPNGPRAAVDNLWLPDGHYLGGKRVEHEPTKEARPCGPQDTCPTPTRCEEDGACRWNLTRHSPAPPQAAPVGDEEAVKEWDEACRTRDLRRKLGAAARMAKCIREQAGEIETQKTWARAAFGHANSWAKRADELEARAEAAERQGGISAAEIVRLTTEISQDHQALAKGRAQLAVMAGALKRLSSTFDHGWASDAPSRHEVIQAAEKIALAALDAARTPAEKAES